MHHLSKKPFFQILSAEWKWIISGSIFSFIFASVLLSGWKSGLIPNLSIPYVYGDDANFALWEIQRILEGWLFENPRSGYPFGSSFFDYPQSDNGNLLILKLFGLLTHSYYGALNLYLLTGFPLVFIVSFFVLKTFSFRSIYAFTSALLFAFAPFHLWRLLGHIFYSWYFVVPLYFLYGWNIFFKSKSLWPFNNLRKIIGSFISLIILSSFGIYFAFFAVILFISCGLASVIKHRSIQGLFLSFILSAMLGIGFGLNVLPNLIYKQQHGTNTEATNRLVSETETYSLKISSLFFPLWIHRINSFKSPFIRYINQFDANETTFSSSLGLVASLGLILLIFSLFSATLGKQIDIRLGLLAFLVLVFFMVSTVGGLNVFFALYVTPLIRGWNRISIFISFAALTALFLVLEENKFLESFYRKKKNLFQMMVFLLLGIGLFDQTPSSLKSITKASENAFLMDKEFITAIENLLPKNSAIYQLPYMGFPEYGRYEGLSDYELTQGFIHSKTLRWSHAGIKGREGDLFYRYLAKEPLEKQLDVIKRLGFSGIYIDRRGFKDHADQLIEQLNKTLGEEPSLVRKDKQVVFYRINPATRVVDLSALNPQQMMKQAGYLITKNGPVYDATVEQRIDFTRIGMPSYLKKIEGLSGVEPWGRWSDGNLSPSVRFDFAKALPSRFNLKLSLHSFGTSVGKKLKIAVGSKVYFIRLDAKTIKEIAIDLKDEKTSRIEFFPPKPGSAPGDARKLSIGFVSLQILPKIIETASVQNP